MRQEQEPGGCRLAQSHLCTVVIVCQGYSVPGKTATASSKLQVLEQGNMSAPALVQGTGVGMLIELFGSAGFARNSV